LVEEIRARLDFIGVDWVADDENGDGNAAEGDAQSKKTVRLLDYACGTGLISRVCGSPHVFKRFSALGASC